MSAFNINYLKFLRKIAYLSKLQIIHRKIPMLKNEIDLNPQNNAQRVRGGLSVS